MTIVFYFLILFFTIMQSVSTKLYQRKDNDVLFFNLIKALSAFLPFLIIILIKFDLNFSLILFSLLYSAFICISNFSGYFALKKGPMSLTSC